MKIFERVREGGICIKELIKCLYWMVIKYRSFKRRLYKQYNIENLTPYKLLDWHQGSYFFLARYNGNKVFIKTDIFQSILENEVLVYEKIKQTIGDVASFMRPVLLDHVDKDFIIYDYISENTLFYYLKNPEELPKQYPEIIVQNLILILKRLHQCKIVHRDIKASNLFVLKNGDVVLFDFSYATPCEQKRVSQETLKRGGLWFNMGPHSQIAPYIWDDAFAVFNVIKEVKAAFGVDLKMYSQQVKKLFGKVSYKISLEERAG